MTATVESFARHLTARLGAASAAPAALLGRLPSHTHAYTAVVAPATADGVAAALETCSLEGWPVLAAGACTWLPASAAGAHDDARPPVLISTTRLSRIVEHEPADLVVGVEAGAPLSSLADHLTRHGQWLPLDPAGEPDATVGAVLSLGASGPLRARHGTPRDMLLGLRIATGDGRLLHFGGRVVKNVAGYDGVRLVTGSGGTLGIVTELYLRVRGAPRADRTLMIECGAGGEGRRRGAGLALRVRDRVACDAVELVSPAVASSLEAAGSAREWTLLVRVMGGEEAVREGIDRVRSEGAPAQTRAGGWLEAPGDVWARLTRVEASAGAALRLTGPATALEEGLDIAADFADIDTVRSPGGTADWQCAAHAADGVVRLWLDRASTPAGETPGLRAHAATTRGWTVRYDRAAVPVKPPQSAAVRELTRRIRAVFDPAGVLSRGSAE